MLAKEFMTSNVLTCSQDQTVEDAAKLMFENNFSVVPIVDENKKLVGIVTESDFVGKEVEIPHALASIKKLLGQNFYFSEIETIYAKVKKRPLSEVMTKNPIAISPETNLTYIVNLMISKKLKRLPVIDNDILVGILTRKDLLRAFMAIK